MLSSAVTMRGDRQTLVGYLSHSFHSCRARQCPGGWAGDSPTQDVPSKFPATTQQQVRGGVGVTAGPWEGRGGGGPRLGTPSMAGRPAERLGFPVLKSSTLASAAAPSVILKVPERSRLASLVLFRFARLISLCVGVVCACGQRPHSTWLLGPGRCGAPRRLGSLIHILKAVKPIQSWRLQLCVESDVSVKHSV